MPKRKANIGRNTKNSKKVKQFEINKRNENAEKAIANEALLTKISPVINVISQTTVGNSSTTTNEVVEKNPATKPIADKPSLTNTTPKIPDLICSKNPEPRRSQRVLDKAKKEAKTNTAKKMYKVRDLLGKRRCNSKQKVFLIESKAQKKERIRSVSQARTNRLNNAFTAQEAKAVAASYKSRTRKLAKRTKRDIQKLTNAKQQRACYSKLSRGTKQIQQATVKYILSSGQIPSVCSLNMDSCTRNVEGRIYIPMLPSDVDCSVQSTCFNSFEEELPHSSKAVNIKWRVMIRNDALETISVESNSCSCLNSLHIPTAYISKTTQKRRSQRVVLNAIKMNARTGSTNSEVAICLRAKKTNNASKHPGVSLDSNDSNLIESTLEHYCGKMNAICAFCHAKHFHGEMPADKKFSTCCHKGKVALNDIKVHPFIEKLLTKLHTQSINFLENIRSFNSALSFASVGSTMASLSGRGPYCFKIQGTMYHSTSSLHPRESETRQNAQVYILDDNEALNNRMQHGSNRNCNRELMQALGAILCEINPYAKAFKMMRQVEIEQHELSLISSNPAPIITMDLVQDALKDPRRYNAATFNEVAIVFTNINGEPPLERNLRIYCTDSNRTKPLPTLHCACDPMTYPIFFPYGDAGWHIQMSTEGGNVGVEQELKEMDGNRYRNNSGPNRGPKGSKISQLQYYAYRLADRDRFNPLLSGGRLTQQFIVDTYVKVEANRLQWVKSNQTKLRVDSYKGLTDFLNERAGREGVIAGTPVILPSTFCGSPRNMNQNYQDALSIVRKFSKPDLFITMTSNPKWTEVTENLQSWQSSEYRPDLIARVFKLKLDELIHDIIHKKMFGNVVAYIFVIEFQKRGLPHAHILIILDVSDKLRTREQIDRFVSAEIPDVETSPRLNALVLKHMIHGPCENKPSSPCMKKRADKYECSKKFPKDFCDETNPNVDGYSRYKRRKNSTNVVDNRWVVPYNATLLLKYNCHINVEVCASIQSVKYLFKYVYKGHDCATIRLGCLNYNEIDSFLDTRFVSAPEAMWRLLEFPMHKQSHATYRLAVHLPDEHPVYFRNGNEREVLQRDHKTTLTAWFDLNTQHEHARQYLYHEIPDYYVYHKKEMEWQTRKAGFGRTIGRMYTVGVQQGEKYYLRLLLLNVPGAMSFENLKTYNGTLHHTFKECALARNLLSDDSSWRLCLEEAVTFRMPFQLRELFCTILIFGDPSKPLELWNMFKDHFVEDYVHKGVENAQNRALFDIQTYISAHGKTMSDYNLPIPTAVIADEDIFDLEMLTRTSNNIIATLNPEQLSIFEKITATIQDNLPRSRCFHLDGCGGSGKTYLYKALSTYFRSKNKTVVCVAPTGLAATLLFKGTTYHSRFKFSIPVVDNCVANVKGNTIEGRILKDACIIIWDEITMTPSYALDAVNKLLQDLMGNTLPMGGKICVVGGDFRQCLPIVPHGTRTDIVERIVKRAKVWKAFKKITLITNMRTDTDQIAHTKWLIELGDGTLSNNYGLDENCVEIPDECVETGDLIDTIFGEVLDPSDIPSYSSKAILCPKNEDVNRLNEQVLKRMLGEEKCYQSVDTIITDTETEKQDNLHNYPPEFLYSLNPSGIPPHCLKLKVGAIVILCRNLNSRKGLCNGTRMVVLTLGEHVIETKVLDGRNKDEVILIPRIDLIPTSSDLPFKLCRRQFPLLLSFVFTINKSQGQSFEYVGIYLKTEVFSHGQLYTAFSRGTSRARIKVKVFATDRQGHLLKSSSTVFTYNCVFKEVYD